MVGQILKCFFKCLSESRTSSLCLKLRMLVGYFLKSTSGLLYKTGWCFQIFVILNCRKMMMMITIDFPIYVYIYIEIYLRWLAEPMRNCGFLQAFVPSLRPWYLQRHLFGYWPHNSQIPLCSWSLRPLGD